MKAGSLTLESRENENENYERGDREGLFTFSRLRLFFGTRTVAGEGLARDPWMPLLLMSGHCRVLFVRCECSIYFVLVIVFCSAGGG